MEFDQNVHQVLKKCGNSNRKRNHEASEQNRLLLQNAVYFKFVYS